MKLWNKDNTDTSKLIEEFTVGRDKEFDLLLAAYDVQGSLAHAEMLSEVGLLSNGEWKLIQNELLQIQEEIKEGKFKMDEAAEDIHSQIEWLLTQRIGEAGKKIHSGRSRNDQVALDIKLYLRAEISILRDEARSLLICSLHKVKNSKTNYFQVTPTCKWPCHPLSDYGLAHMQKAWWMTLNYLLLPIIS